MGHHRGYRIRTSVCLLHLDVLQIQQERFRIDSPEKNGLQPQEDPGAHLIRFQVCFLTYTKWKIFKPLASSVPKWRA